MLKKSKFNAFHNIVSNHYSLEAQKGHKNHANPKPSLEEKANIAALRKLEFTICFIQWQLKI